MLNGGRVLALAATLVAALVAAPASADAACPPGQTPSSIPGAGVVCVTVTDPGAPGGGGDGPGPVSGGGGGGCAKADGTPIDCVRPYGVWVSAHQCYAHPVTVPPGDPAWEGHTDGAVWMCALTSDGEPVVTFWVPPGGPAAAPPDPGQLAQSAVGALQLATADVHVAPAYPDPAVVGIETWLWLPPDQWRALSRTVRAGGTAVTVTATPAQVRWDLGPGETTCFDAGRAWEDGMGDRAATRCGYTYDRTSANEPEGVFRVSATIRYDVDWVCSGACTSASGTLGLVDAPAGSGAVRVVQRQTVVVR